MSELVIVKKSDMVAVADAVRRNSDTTEPMTLGEIIEGIDEIGATGITPEGTIEITENGTYDVTSYASASVDVGGGVNPLDALIDGSITEVTSNVTSVRDYAFYYQHNLTTANFPLATKLGSNTFTECGNLNYINLPLVTSSGSTTFSRCSKLTTANLPLVTEIGSQFFYSCIALTSVNIPLVTFVGDQAFYTCVRLSSVDLPRVTRIKSYVFYDCRSLKSVILRSTTICTLDSTTSFNNCCHYHGTVNATYNPNGDKDGYIYVPKALIEDYKVATNWVTYASQFRALEDYTVDGTITGELDETKI